MVSENKQIVHSVIPNDLRAWLQARARAEGRSVSNLIAVLLEQARKDDNLSSGNKDKPGK
jgi:hypothetical protein